MWGEDPLYPNTIGNMFSRDTELVVGFTIAALLLVPAAVIVSLYPLNLILGAINFYTASATLGDIKLVVAIAVLLGFVVALRLSFVDAVRKKSILLACLLVPGILLVISGPDRIGSFTPAQGDSKAFYPENFATAEITARIKSLHNSFGSAGWPLASIEKTVSLQKNTEEAIANWKARLKRDALRAALEEKEAQLIQKDFLLREVDHRVRNSLALISSMLQLQARSTEDPTVREKFVEASRRVITVGHVHQRLYQTGELRTLDFGDYLRALTSDLSDSSGPQNSKRLILETASATLGADIVIPLGLIVNELVTNAFKHGGEAGAPLTVNVAFSHNEKEMRLIVQDDGKGLPEWFDPRQSKGLGMRLVQGLVTQLSAKLDFEVMYPGTRFTVTVPGKARDIGIE